MNDMKCSRCGLVNPASAGACSWCGASFFAGARNNAPRGKLWSRRWPYLVLLGAAGMVLCLLTLSVALWSAFGTKTLSHADAAALLREDERFKRPLVAHLTTRMNVLTLNNNLILDDLMRRHYRRAKVLRDLGLATATYEREGTGQKNCAHRPAQVSAVDDFFAAPGQTTIIPQHFKCADVLRYRLSVSFDLPAAPDPARGKDKTSRQSGVEALMAIKQKLPESYFDSDVSFAKGGKFYEIGAVELVEVSDGRTLRDGTFAFGFKFRFRPTNKLGELFDPASEAHKSLSAEESKLFAGGLGDERFSQAQGAGSDQILFGEAVIMRSRGPLRRGWVIKSVEVGGEPAYPYAFHRTVTSN